MKIKNWEKRGASKFQYLWKNIMRKIHLQIEKPNHRHVTTKLYVYSFDTNKNSKLIQEKEFNTTQEALNYAIAYMRRNP